MFPPEGQSAMAIGQNGVSASHPDVQQNTFLRRRMVWGLVLTPVAGLLGPVFASLFFLVMSGNESAGALISMMARSTTRSNQRDARPLTTELANLLATHGRTTQMVNLCLGKLE